MHGAVTRLYNIIGPTATRAPHKQLVRLTSIQATPYPYIGPTSEISCLIMQCNVNHRKLLSVYKTCHSCLRY